jgi:hypothetical protein
LRSTAPKRSDAGGVCAELGLTDGELEGLCEVAGGFAQLAQLGQRPQVGVVLSQQLAQHRLGGRCIATTLGQRLRLAVQLFAARLVHL